MPSLSDEPIGRGSPGCSGFSNFFADPEFVGRVSDPIRARTRDLNVRPSHSGTWKIAIYISACRYIQYFGSCIDASQRTSTASRSSTFSLFANAMALPTCRAALGCAAVVRICSLLLLWLTIFGAQTATAQTQPVPSDVPPCGVCDPPSTLVQYTIGARPALTVTH